MGHDSKTFTAALIDMAVKRYISIHQERNKYWIERDTAPETVLSDDELALAGVSHRDQRACGLRTEQC